jgi:outer membrane receptor protein involved in Fe transport
VELSHQKIWDKFSVNTTAYYQKIQDEISRFLDYRADGVTISTYENIGESNRYGLELIASYRPFKWWTISVDGDFSYQKLTTVTVESTLNQENNRWSLRFTSRKTLPKGFSVQMDARYRGKRLTNQGIIEPMYGINLGVRKSLLDRKLNLSLNIRDIFNWYEFNFIASDNQALQQERRFKWESQVFTFSLSYNFGTPVKGPQRKRNRGDRGDYGDDDDMDM